MSSAPGVGTGAAADRAGVAGACTCAYCAGSGDAVLPWV